MKGKGEHNDRLKKRGLLKQNDDKGQTSDDFYQDNLYIGRDIRN